MPDYPQEAYSDEEEWNDNYVEEQRDLWEDSTQGNYPSARKPDSLFTLFKNVWRTNDSSKVGNLEKGELGDLNISVRDCQNIALIANLLHHKKFARYFLNQGEITLATSMSRKGWFVELFVTSKKFAHKGTVNNLKQNQPEKWRIFGKKPEQNQEPEA